MKTFLASMAVLLILMVAIGLYSKYLDDSMDDIEKCLKDISYNVNEYNWSECQKKMYLLSDIWKKNEPILAMFNDHEDVDNIKLAIGELNENIFQESYEHTSKSLTETKILLERIRKNETLSLENILKVSHYKVSSHNML